MCDESKPFLMYRRGLSVMATSESRAQKFAEGGLTFNFKEHNQTFSNLFKETFQTFTYAEVPERPNGIEAFAVQA